MTCLNGNPCPTPSPTPLPLTMMDLLVRSPETITDLIDATVVTMTHEALRDWASDLLWSVMADATPDAPSDVLAILVSEGVPVAMAETVATIAVAFGSMSVGSCPSDWQVLSLAHDALEGREGVRTDHEMQGRSNVGQVASRTLKGVSQ